MGRTAIAGERVVEVAGAFQLARQGVQQPTAPPFQQAAPIRRPEFRQQARRIAPTGRQAGTAPKLGDLLAQRVEAKVALKCFPIGELPRFAAERDSLEAEHAKVAQHEGSEILLAVAEEEQLVQQEVVRIAQAQPTAVPANAPATHPLGNPRHDAGDALRLRPLAGNLPEQAAKLRHRQQFEQRLRCHRRATLDKPKRRKLRQRRFDIAHLRVAKPIFPNQRPPPDETGEEPLARLARRPQLQAEPQLLLFKDVAVTFEHRVDQREQIPGVVVRWRRRTRLQPHDWHSGCRNVRVVLGQRRLGASAHSRIVPQAVHSHTVSCAVPQAQPWRWP